MTQTNQLAEKARHEFDAGYTGLSARCNKLVVDGGGGATTCDLPREQHAPPCLAPPGSLCTDTGCWDEDRCVLLSRDHSEEADHG